MSSPTQVCCHYPDSQACSFYSRLSVALQDACFPQSIQSLQPHYKSPEEKVSSSFGKTIYSLDKKIPAALRAKGFELCKSIIVLIVAA